MAKSLSPDAAFLAPGFTLGVATSSFQIEGGAESREKCIWDTFCEQPGKIQDNSHGLVACDHVNRWEEDIELIRSLNVDAYRFSVSWPRVIRADGTTNQEGLNFYINILDRLQSYGIKAYVTLYHWDLPQYLEDNGGWLNRDTAIAFARYTGVVVDAFGDRVHSYATLNEPYCSAYLGYEAGIHAPGKVGKEYGKKAIHHLLLAHGLAMKVLRERVPHIQSGIVLNFTPFYPESDSEEDVQATQVAHTHFNDWYIKPIVGGQYPSLLNELPAAHRPEIHEEDLAVISQPVDFIGVNYYTRSVVRADGTNDPILLEPTADCEKTAMGWEIYPQGLTDLLNQLHRDYTMPPIIITENGLASDDALDHGEVHDEQRIRYLQTHMDAVAEAMKAGVNISGYFVWSLMDNFEWALGYEKRFGIVYVEYDSQRRTLKDSALALQAMLANR